MHSIIEQLKAARLAQNITQSEMAERLGTTQGHISMIEARKVDPRLSNVVEIARLLDQEPILVPRAYLPAIRCLLSSSSIPLSDLDSGERDSTD